MSGAGLFFRAHILDLREDGHGFCAVVNALQVVIVECRVVRKDRRQDAFDRKGTAHCTVMPMPERTKEFDLFGV